MVSSFDLMQYGVNSCTDDRETNVEKGENKAKKAWQEIYSFKAPGLTFEHLNKDDKKKLT